MAANYITNPLGVLATGLIIVAAVMLAVSHARNKRLKANMEDAIAERTAELEAKTEMAKASARAKSDFLSKMSHEIRTPMNAIIGMAQIARGSDSLEKAMQAFDTMEDHSKHLLGIINDILDYSKIESGNIELEEKLFSLKQSISFVVSMLTPKAKEKNIDFCVTVEDFAHDGIVSDSLRLNQVLINLLSNAMKFTDEGGRVELFAEEITHMDGKGAYRFSVRDNGIGMEQEQVRKLFTPFTQAGSDVSRIYGGTGLGLAISKSIVTMLGGDIELETSKGEGSTFTFTISVRAQEFALGTEKQVDDYEAAPALGGRRILNVDDIAINREIVRALLEETGAEVEQAVDGLDAFVKYSESPEGYYDLIFMDLQMPNLDGYAATLKIRECGRADAKTVRIIAMTANVMREDVDRAFEVGMDAYLAKPIDMGVLYQTLEEWL